MYSNDFGESQEDYEGFYANKIIDPNYYHTLIEFHELKQETKRAFQFLSVNDELVWVPKSLVRNFNLKEKTMLVWEKFSGLDKLRYKKKQR